MGGLFGLSGNPADRATVGSLNNSGTAFVDGGSTLQINGDVNNSGFLYTAVFGVGGNTLNITGILTNNPGAAFTLIGTGNVANVGTLNNSGLADVERGATLNLTNQPGGITDVVTGSDFYLAGTFNAGINNGFYQLTSVEGTLTLYNGRVTTDRKSVV